MNILQLISSGGFYGAEAMVLNLCRALRHKRHAVHLGVFINQVNPNQELAQRARDLGFEVATLPCGGRLDVSTAKSIRRLIERSGIDIIHSHGYKSNMYALAANWFTRRALVSTCHNWTGQTRALRVYAMFDCFNLRFFDRIFCVSQEVQNRLLRSGVPGRKLQVTSNGIPVSDFASAGPQKDSQELAVGMVGRLVEEKGFQLVLKSAPEIVKQFPEVRFVLAGDGPQRQAWTQMVQDLGLESHVCFAGVQTDMPRLYRSLNMLVLPSFNEGMPMTILEAMAAGIPVIATRVGAIPTTIRHGQNGMLIEPGNVEELQGAIERLLGDAALRDNLGTCGREYVQQNASMERVAEQYIDQYAELLGKGVRAPVCNF